MKKLFAVLISLTLILMMGAPAFAEETTNATNTGTITISNAIKDATYSIYKMFDFAPVAGSETQGRYTVVAEWADFLTNDATAKEYLAVDTDANTIKWIGSDDGTPAQAAEKAELAKAAVAYATTNRIAATETKTAAADGEVIFENVQLGYYAIDTSLGTVCALTNVDNTFVAHEKNAKPEVDKFVQEDSEVTETDEAWGKVNDAAIGETVNFKATVTVATGATNYVLYDTMSDGLTFDKSVTVKVDGEIVDASNYTLTYESLADCTFKVEFKNEYIETLEAGKVIEVYYSATLNENAVVAGEGNPNKVVLKYGDNNEFTTNEKETKTYTWKMDVFKFVKEGDNKTPLAGAQFQLLDEEGNAVKFTKVTGEAVPTYKVAADGEATITTDTTGKFVIVGLDEGQYQLDEIMAPAGYNKIAAPLDVVITSDYDEDNLTATYEINEKTPATIEVENKTGSLLPETGGIGTTIFYVVGGVLMLAAVIILIAKKRMNSFA